MNFMKVLFAQLLTTTMVLAGLLVALHYDWSDYVHTNYGVPLFWATHTESTITGPADIWSVNVTNMIVDVAIWAVLSIVLVAAIDALKRRRT